SQFGTVGPRVQCRGPDHILVLKALMAACNGPGQQPVHQPAGFENPTLGSFINSRPLQRSHLGLMPNYARCMAQKWRVNVTTGAPDEAKAQDIVRRLPDDSRPAYIGYGDDLALRI